MEVLGQKWSESHEEVDKVNKSGKVLVYMLTAHVLRKTVRFLTHLLTLWPKRKYQTCVDCGFLIWKMETTVTGGELFWREIIHTQGLTYNELPESVSLPSESAVKTEQRWRVKELLKGEEEESGLRERYDQGNALWSQPQVLTVVSSPASGHGKERFLVEQMGHFESEMSEGSFIWLWEPSKWRLHPGEEETADPKHAELGDKWWCWEQDGHISF